HEHSVYDRRDLHIDIEGLLHGSKSGELTVPFRPLDSIELLEKQAKGEEPPELSFKGARPEARQAMLDRIAQGLPAALQEREPEKPKAGAVSAAAAAAAAGGEVEILSESKIRAKRMRAEREAKAYTDRGEPIPPEITANIEKYRNMKPGEAATAVAGAPGGGGGGAVLTGLNDDGSMRFPPGVGDGPKGDPNSAEKVRARRMRAERTFNTLTAAGEPIPDDVAKTLYDLGSDLAPGGTIWATLGGGAGGAAAAASSAPVTGTN